MTRDTLSLLGVALALYLLVTVDAACAGFRAAAGWSLLIRKRDYYRAALRRGALFGQRLLVLPLLLVLILFAVAPDRGGLTTAFHLAGLRLLTVYVPYAALVVVAVVMRASGSVDLGSFASTVLFGPLLFVRPLVAVGGVGWAIVSTRHWQVALFLVVMLLLFIPVERFLSSGRRWID